MENIDEFKIVYWENKNFTQNLNRYLIREEPLSIRVEGKSYAVIMRTPGDELDHAAGFCLSEGIIENFDDISNIACCKEENTNVVTITLSNQRRSKISNVLDRKYYISQSSCGICGKEFIKDLCQTTKIFDDNIKINIKIAYECIEKLTQYQPLRFQTKASHAAAIFDFNGNLLSSSEDVGRHNALDKAIGKLFLEGNLNKAVFCILSSRISYELVQKAAIAKIPIILAISRPTSLAVKLSYELNMTLCCLSEKQGLYIFCGENRFIF